MTKTTREINKWLGITYSDLKETYENSRKIVITIPNYRAKSRNETNKKHWTKYYQHRKEIAQLISVYAKDKQTISPAHVTIEAYYKGKRAVDTSNCDDKCIIDGLMDAGILEDDTPEHNPIVTKMAFSETGEDKLVITVNAV